MGNETLKKLAQDYAIGQIDRHNYRQQRARLIDEITGYKDSPQSSSATAQSDDIANPPLAGSSGLLTSSFNAKVVLIAAVVIAIIIVAIFMAKNGDNNNKQANTTSQLTPHKAETLVSTFINYDDWTSERISQFVAGWQRLTDLQKLEAKQASWFQSLIEIMKMRLMEQQKTANTDSDDAQQKAQSIKNLADLLGIHL